MRLNLVAIRVEMARRNINQSKLAELVGVDKSHISHIMRGKNNVSLDTLGKLSKALDLTPNELTELECEQKDLLEDLMLEQQEGA